MTTRLYKNIDTGETTADYGTFLNWKAAEYECAEYHIKRKYNQESPLA